MAKHGGPDPQITSRNRKYFTISGSYYLSALQRGAPKHLITDKICTSCKRPYSSELTCGPTCLRCQAMKEKADREQTQADRNNTKFLT